MTSVTANEISMTRNKWLRRAGVAGFWFFLIKGLLWLAAPFVFYFVM